MRVGRLLVVWLSVGYYLSHPKVKCETYALFEVDIAFDAVVVVDAIVTIDPSSMPSE